MDCLSAGILVADHLCEPIPRLPAAGELVLADALPLCLGGCAANAAIDLRRLGVDVGVVGCVGQDAFGDFVVDTLKAHGVDTAAVRRSAEHGTSGTLIINVEREDRRFIHTPGANGALRAADIPLELVRSARVLYLGGYLMMPSMRHEQVAELLAAARAAGVATVLDVVLPRSSEDLTGFDEVLAQTDVFLPNRDEAKAMTGLDDPLEQADKFRAAGARTVVITCGDEGAVLVGENERLWSGIYPTDFVGGTGAGDAFDAGYIAGMLAGASPRECLQWGSALGASCVRAIGATDGVFTRDEAEAFLRQHELPLRSL